MTTTLHTYLGYRDAQAAIDWIVEVFGFATTMSFPDERGGLAHAELRRDDAALVVFTDHDGYERSPRRGETCGTGVYLAVDDAAEVDAAFARATAADAPVVWKPETTQWGNYRIRVLDPEGYEWTLGVHRPGQPAEWSG